MIMRTIFSAFRFVAVFVFLASAISPASAQGDEQRLAEAKIQISNYLRYFKFETTVSTKEIDRLADDSLQIGLTVRQFAES